MINTILQQLESKKSEIKKEILNHDLFKMNRDDAVKFLISRLETSIFISRGKLFSLFKTEDIYIDSEKNVRIIQKSLPFIFHNLVETSQVDSKKIEVHDLILLLQRVSDYLEFEDFIKLYKIQVVNVVFQNQTIRFEYKRDEYKINDIYNGYWHMLERQSAITGATNLQDITDKMFDLTVNFNINNFTLEDLVERFDLGMSDFKIYTKDDEILFDSKDKFHNTSKIREFVVANKDEEFWNDMNIYNAEDWESLLQDEKVIGIISRNSEPFNNYVDYCCDIFDEGEIYNKIQDELSIYADELRQEIKENTKDNVITKENFDKLKEKYEVEDYEVEKEEIEEIEKNEEVEKTNEKEIDF